MVRSIKEREVQNAETRNKQDTGLVANVDETVIRFVKWLIRFLLIRLLVHLMRKAYDYVING